MEINALSLGFALAVLYAACMLVVAVCAKLGVYKKAAEMLQQFHIYFTLSTRGIILGMIEGGVWGFILGLAAGLLYNAFLD